MSKLVRELGMPRVWNFERIFSSSPCALLVLNQPLNAAQCNSISDLWAAAAGLRIAVDGGCNRLFESLPELTPDLITGDFDSINEHVKKTYEERGCAVVHTPDQNFTDFTKCLQVLATQPRLDVESVIAFCATGGRLDQVMGNINTLYRSSKFLSPPVILHSGYEMTWVLHTGKHRIMAGEGFRNANCGVVPIGTSVTASSTGLEWNFNATRLSFGELVSTSNKMKANEVTIETDGPVLWTMCTDDVR